MEENKEEIQHGVRGAYYANTPAGLRPVIECLCGEIVSEMDWADTGAMFDEHLDEVE